MEKEETGYRIRATLSTESQISEQANKVKGQLFKDKGYPEM